MVRTEILLVLEAIASFPNIISPTSLIVNRFLKNNFVFFAKSYCDTL